MQHNQITRQLAMLGAIIVNSIIPKEFLDCEKAALDDKIVSLTVALILIAVVLLPIGIKILLTANYTEYGVVEGSTIDTILDNIPLISLVVVFMAILGFMKVKK